MSDFGDTIKDIESVKDNQDMISILANGFMDEEQVGSFLKFVLSDYEEIITPEEILGDWAAALKRFKTMKKRSSKEDKLRSDIMGLISQRLYIYLMNPNNTITDENFDNLVKYLTCEKFISSDMIFMLLRRLNSNENPNHAQFIESIKRGDSELEKRLLEVA